MIRWAGLTICLLGVVAVGGAPKLENPDCKAGLYNCSCLRSGTHWTPGNPRAPKFPTDQLNKQGLTCWSDMAQYNIPKGKKAEFMDKAYAEAKTSKKILLYVANTGG